MNWSEELEIGIIHVSVIAVSGLSEFSSTILCFFFILFLSYFFSLLLTKELDKRAPPFHQLIFLFQHSSVIRPLSIHSFIPFSIVAAIYFPALPKLPAKLRTHPAKELTLYFYSCSQSFPNRDLHNPSTIKTHPKRSFGSKPKLKLQSFIKCYSRTTPPPPPLPSTTSAKQALLFAVPQTKRKEKKKKASLPRGQRTKPLLSRVRESGRLQETN